MSQNYQFPIARANEAAVEAAQATLDNVRQRALRSEAAWHEMADRTLKMEKEREKARAERERRNAQMQSSDDNTTA